MTLIVGATWRNRCWLGGDGAAIDEGLRIPIRTPKVWLAASGAVAVGVAGAMGGDPALRSVDWQGSSRWLLREAASEIAQACTSYGIEPESPQALIGCEGRLFYYMGREVYEAADKFAALGSADVFGWAWLAATERGWDPEHRLRKCLTLAAGYCKDVGGKPTVVHTT